VLADFGARVIKVENPKGGDLARSLGADVTFAGWIENDEVRDLYRRSRAVIMPGVEDFGMVPVEAQACGRPVVVLAEGGAPESVVDGVSGILVREGSVDAFAEALSDVSRRSWDSDAIRAHAETFGTARFKQEFRKIVDDVEQAHEDDPNAASYAQRPRNTAAREDNE